MSRKMQKITISTVGNLYLADIEINGEKQTGHGKSIPEAIGNLVLDHYDFFKIKATIDPEVNLNDFPRHE